MSASRPTIDAAKGGNYQYNKYIYSCVESETVSSIVYSLCRPLRMRILAKRGRARIKYTLKDRASGILCGTEERSLNERSQYIILLRYAFFRVRRGLDAEKDGSKAYVKLRSLYVSLERYACQSNLLCIGRISERCTIMRFSFLP